MNDRVLVFASGSVESQAGWHAAICGGWRQCPLRARWEQYRTVRNRPRLRRWLEDWRGRGFHNPPGRCAPPCGHLTGHLW